MHPTAITDKNDSIWNPPTQERILRILTRAGLVLGVSVDRSDMHVSESSGDTPTDPFHALQVSGRKAGILLRETQFDSVDDAIDFVREGCPVILAAVDGSFVVLEQFAGRKIEASIIADRVTTQLVSRGQLQKLLSKELHPRVFVAKQEFECDSTSASPAHAHTGHHHEHPTPLHRFLGLLSLDRRDVWTVILFAFVSGILALATPLAVESLVNVVSWGTYMQPLIMLGLMLLTCLGLAGVLKVLQAVVVEMIQRRQFVRIVSDLAHRFPRANQASLVGEYPRELANRVFDVMTIQKATAILLLDGVSIVLTTMIGLLLLAFYHPLLLGFDIVLVLSMISITWILGRGGIRTAIEESMTKYAVAHWLQDVLASPTVFKTGGGEALAVARANQLTTEYIYARQQQFRVVLRQIMFAIGLQVIASTALLALGGWLVIDGQLTLGQLVASELVVTVVVGAFAKAGKSLEKFYDLMAGIDKVGHLLDIPIDPRDDQSVVEDGAAEASWSDLVFEGPAGQSRVPAANVAAGDRVAIVGDDLSGCSLLARALAGLVEPNHGLVQTAGLDSARVAESDAGRLIGYVGGREIFHGSLRENIDLARIGIGQRRVREVIAQVGLSDAVLRLPDGLDTELQTDGFPLSRVQAIQLIFARVIAAKPKLLIIDRLLDELDAASQTHLWKTLASPDSSWTLVVVTNREDIARRCNAQISVRRSEVLS